MTSFSESISQELIKSKYKHIDASINFSSILDVPQNTFSQSTANIQDSLAYILRKKAVEHLAQSQSATSKAFRGEYYSATQEEYKIYLAKQAKKGTWGTDIEAIALGELLHCNVVVTSVCANRADKTWCLHLESKDAPTIHLYNDNNYHWTNDPLSPTKGGGDCLYNATAKALQQICLPRIATTNLSSKSIFQPNSMEKEAIKNQMIIEKSIAKAIKNHQSPDEKEQDYKKEELRISMLSEDEKNQITNDYLLALKLAQDINPDEINQGNRI